MGAEPTVVCPSCHNEIKLTDSLAAPLVEATRRAYEEKLSRQRVESIQREQALRKREEELAAQKEAVEATVNEKLKQERDKLAAEAAQREAAMKEREAALAKEKESLDAAVAETLKSEREKIAAEEAKRAKLMLGDELERKEKANADLTAALKVRDEKLAEAQKAQVQALQKERELKQKERELELTLEKRLAESQQTLRQEAQRQADEQWTLKLAEEKLKIESMQRTIDELKKKAEQGSQQAQGEALELQLETLLAEKFPHDRIEPVAKGQRGADIFQRVMTPTGSQCGSILWESKNVKNWQNGWLPKLREDQRAAKAEIAAIVSAVLPVGVETFDQIDGVWIIHPRCVLPVALSLRHMLIEVHCARQANEGQQTKMELVYHYLNGPRFRLRVQGIVEAFNNMNDDLAKEKKGILKFWAQRERQIHRVMESTIGLYGDLQGIAGKTLQEIEGLEWDGEQPALPA